MSTIFKLMKKSIPFMSDVECYGAFDDIKQYLTNQLLLISLVFGKPLLLYARPMDHAFRALLAQTDEKEMSKQFIISCDDDQN